MIEPTVDLREVARRWLDQAASQPLSAAAGAPDEYGEAFADVYDDWYGDDDTGGDDTGAAVAFLATLARRAAGTRATPRVLELGAGTGRLAIPLAGALGPAAVTALDASAAMLGLLHGKVGADAVVTVRGDMARPLPDGPFDVVVIARNTLFNLPDDAAQRRCLAEIARVLQPDGRFVVQAFVPTSEPDTDVHVAERPLPDGGRLVTASRADPTTQVLRGCHVTADGDGAPTVRPWVVHWKSPEQLDAVCNHFGLLVELRVSDWSGAVFDSESPEHVTVFCHRNA